MSVMRRQGGLAVLVAVSVALAFLATGYHTHGLPGVRTDDDALDASPRSPSISFVCLVCTLVHVSPTPPVGCAEPYVPGAEQRLKPPDAATLPHGPALCSHASRAPPAPRGLGA